MPATLHRRAFRAAALAPALALAALALAGCDKCGNRVNINVPSLQHSCSDGGQTPR